LILTRILGYWTIVKKDAWTDPLEKASSNARKGLGFLYRGLLFLDFELLMLVKLKPPFNNAQVLVLDRYVYDLIIDLAVTNLHSPFYARMILRMMPKPNIAYFTDASSDVIAERRPNFHKEELEVKITAYRKLARILDFDFISTTREFEENKVYIQKQTLASLEQELGNFR
jgi:thymidylate kinase